MLADALFPSCCPVLEALCAQLDDADLVKVAQCRLRRVVAIALREMARRPVFAMLKDISKNGRWRSSQEFHNVCKTGSWWGVHVMIQKGATAWDAGLRGACIGGNRELVGLLLKNGATDLNGGLVFACRGGHDCPGHASLQ